MTTTEQAGEVTFTVTLEDGQQLTYQAARMPRHWRSWLLRQVPRGTDLWDATVKVSRP